MKLGELAKTGIHESEQENTYTLGELVKAIPEVFGNTSLWAEAESEDAIRDLTEQPRIYSHSKLKGIISKRGLSEDVGKLWEEGYLVMLVDDPDNPWKTLFEYAGDSRLIADWLEHGIEAEYLLGTKCYILRQAGTILGYASSDGYPQSATNEASRKFLHEALERRMFLIRRIAINLEKDSE